MESSASGVEDSFTSETTEEDALDLDFEVATDNLSPAATLAAPMVVRITADSTYDASVELTDVTASGANAQHLTYGLVSVADPAACTPTATGSTLVPAGTALNSVGAGPQSFSLTQGADGAARTPVTVCFQVTAGETLEQGESATAVWQFVATSVE